MVTCLRMNIAHWIVHIHIQQVIHRRKSIQRTIDVDQQHRSRHIRVSTRINIDKSR
jgi:hypothetical protein